MSGDEINTSSSLFDLSSLKQGLREGLEGQDSPMKSVLSKYDSYSFEDNDCTITTIRLNGKAPQPRSSFLACLLRNNQIFIHGGNDHENDFSDAHMLDLDNLTWKPFEMANATKLTLTGHAGFCIPVQEDYPNDLIYIFGGWDGTKYLDTSFLINCKNKDYVQSYYEAWVGSSLDKPRASKSCSDARFFCSEIPAGRRDHTITLNTIKQKLYLFGGWNSLNWSYEENEFNDLWIMDSNWVWTFEKTKGEIPPGRRGHTAIFSEEINHIVIYGGVYGYNKILDDCYILNIHDRVWKCVETKADRSPEGRAWHTGSKVGSNIYYIGGMKCNHEFSNEILAFNIFTWEWRDIRCKDQHLMGPRCGHQALVYNNSCILILGGYGKSDLNSESQSELGVGVDEPKDQNQEADSKIKGSNRYSFNNLILIHLTPEPEVKREPLIIFKGKDTPTSITTRNSFKNGWNAARFPTEEKYNRDKGNKKNIGEEENDDEGDMFKYFEDKNITESESPIRNYKK